MNLEIQLNLEILRENPIYESVHVLVEQQWWHNFFLPETSSLGGYSDILFLVCLARRNCSGQNEGPSKNKRR